MMARAIIAGAFCVGLASGAFGQSSTFTAPTTRKKLPKVKVTCNGGTGFAVDYGQTTNLCCTVAPKSRAPKIIFSGSADGVFTTSTATASGCDVSVQVQSSAKVCLAQSNVLANLNGNVIAKVPGTVNLPKTETSSNLNQPIRDCSILTDANGNPLPSSKNDFLDQWLATELTAANSNLNLTGVVFAEQWKITSNSCSGIVSTAAPVGFQSPLASQDFPGAAPSKSNQWVDIIGFCGAVLAGAQPPTNCSIVRRQTVTVGACPTITGQQVISFDGSGAVSTSRSAVFQ